MFQSLLVPLDGSPFGEEALPMAEALARRSAARIHLVHVRPGAPEDGPMAAHEEEEARAYLDAVVERVCDDVGESCSFALLAQPSSEGLGIAPPSTAISAALQEYVGRNGVDLMVMTTHGRSGLSRAWLGSVADSFVRHTSIPVLLLRPGKGRRGALEQARGAFRKIVVPLDGSAASEEILEPALALASPDARLLLLRVVAPAYDMGSPYVLRSVHLDEEATHHRRVRASDDLARVAERLRAEGAWVSTSTVLDPVPADAVLGFAEENGADCVAMATRGLGGWSRVVLGSTADKVVRGSTLPVLLLRPALTARATRPQAEAAARA